MTGTVILPVALRPKHRRKCQFQNLKILFNEEITFVPNGEIPAHWRILRYMGVGNRGWGGVWGEGVGVMGAVNI